MSMDLYRKIIDEAATIESIGSLILHGLGEPLLDPNLNERLSYEQVVKSIYEDEMILKMSTTQLKLPLYRSHPTPRKGLHIVEEPHTLSDEALLQSYVPVKVGTVQTIGEGANPDHLRASNTLIRCPASAFP